MCGHVLRRPETLMLGENKCRDSLIRTRRVKRFAVPNEQCVRPAPSSFSGGAPLYPMSNREWLPERADPGPCLLLSHRIAVSMMTPKRGLDASHIQSLFSCSVSSSPSSPMHLSLVPSHALDPGTSQRWARKRHAPPCSRLSRTASRRRSTQKPTARPGPPGSGGHGA